MPCALHRLGILTVVVAVVGPAAIAQQPPPLLDDRIAPLPVAEEIALALSAAPTPVAEGAGAYKEPHAAGRVNAAALWITWTTLPAQEPSPCAPRERAALADHPERVATFVHAAQSGDTARLAAFWSLATREGTPLVEPRPGQADCLRVTFVYRDALARTVRLVGGFGAWLDTLGQLEHVPGTDTWIRSLWLDAATRVGYAFGVSDSLLSPRMRPPRPLRIALDPNNPRVYRGLVPRSTFLGPNAAGERWTSPRPNVPRGTVDTLRLPMPGRDTSVRVWVYLPPGYARGTPALPLLALFDGGAFWSSEIVGTPAMVDNLIADGLVDPVIVLFLPQEPDPPARQRTMGNNADYARFIAQDVIPLVQARYGGATDPARVVIGGSSLGGLAASHVAFLYSNVVGNVLSLSGSYQWGGAGDSTAEWLTRQYQAAPRRPLRFYLEVGEYEVGAPPGGLSLVQVNRNFRDVLLAKGYTVTFAVARGGHDYLSWRGTLAEALPLFFGRPGGPGRPRDAEPALRRSPG